MTLKKSHIAAALLALTLPALSSCGNPYVEPLPPRDRFHWPVGMAIHPEGRFLYVVNSNFDTRYREDIGGTISVVDLERLELLPSNGPFIPSFGGQIVLNGDASRAYVTVRSDNQVLALDVGETGSTISCLNGDVPSSDVERCSLQRVPDRDGGANVPSDPFGLDVWTLPRVSLVVSDTENGDFTVTLRSANADESVVYASEGDSDVLFARGVAAEIDTLPDYTAVADDNEVIIRRIDGVSFAVELSNETLAAVVNNSLDVLGVSHLRGANVTAMSVPRSGISGSSMAFAELVNGSNDIKRRPGTSDFYAAGRVSRELAVFRPYLSDSGEVQAIIDRGAVNLNHLTSVVDARAIEFEPDGQTVYVATRNPDALHVIDLGPEDPETGTGRLDRVVRSITLARQPSDITRHQRADGKVLLYIPCFDAQVIQVVDPELGAVIDEIELGARPYEFVIDTGANCSFSNPRCRGYVTLFDDLPTAYGTCDDNRKEPCGSVGVIELNPQDSRYHRLISKVD